MNRIANPLGLLCCLCACPQSRPPADYTLVLEGKVALETPISNLQIDVVDDSPEFSRKVWASTFSPDGFFSFSFVTQSFGPFRIVARASDESTVGLDEPTYEDVATHAVAIIRPSRQLETVFYIADRKDTTYKNIAVNGLTSLASWTAQAYIARGREWDEATRTSHRLWSNYIDPDGNYDVRFAQGKRADEPLSSALNISERVALFHGGLSRLAAEAAIRASNTFYSVDVLAQLQQDLTDGVLAGSDSDGELVFMSSAKVVLLDDDTLRGTLAQSITDWLNNKPLEERPHAPNATGLTLEMLGRTNFLSEISGNTSVLFGTTQEIAPPRIDIRVLNNGAVGVRHVIGGPPETFSQAMQLQIEINPGDDDIPLKSATLFLQVNNDAQDCTIAAPGLSEPRFVTEGQYAEYSMPLGNRFDKYSKAIGVGGSCNGVMHVVVEAKGVSGPTATQRIRVDVDTTPPVIQWGVGRYQEETTPRYDGLELTGFEGEETPFHVYSEPLIQKYVSTLDHIPPYSTNTPMIPLNGLDRPGAAMQEPGSLLANLVARYCYAPPTQPERCNPEKALTNGAAWLDAPLSDASIANWELRVSYQDLFTESSPTEIIRHGEAVQTVHLVLADEAGNMSRDSFGFKLRAKVPQIRILECEDIAPSPSSQTLGDVASALSGPIPQERMTLHYADYNIPLPAELQHKSRVPQDPIRLHVGSPNYRSVITEYALYGSYISSYPAGVHPLGDRCSSGHWFGEAEQYACVSGTVPTGGSLTFPRYQTLSGGLSVYPMVVWSDAGLCTLASYPQNPVYYSLDDVLIGFNSLTGSFTCTIRAGRWTAAWEHDFVPYFEQVAPSGNVGLSKVNGAFEIAANQTYTLTVVTKTPQDDFPEYLFTQKDGRYLAGPADTRAYAKKSNVQGDWIHEYDVYHAINAYRFDGQSAPLQAVFPAANHMQVEFEETCDPSISFTVTEPPPP